MFKLELGASVVNKLNLNNYGKDLLKSKFSVAPSVNIGYSRYIIKNFGINVNVGIQIIPFNTSFNFEVTEDHPLKGNHDLNEYFYTIGLSNMNLLVFKDLLVKPNLKVAFSAGIQRNILYSYEASLDYYHGFTDNDITLHTYHFEIEDTGTYKFFSYIVQCGVNRKYGKHHHVFGSLRFHYYPDIIGKGYYQFYNYPWESCGTVELGMNYLGIQFGYGFSF